MEVRNKQGSGRMLVPWVFLAVYACRLSVALVFDVRSNGGQECFERTLHADAHVMVHYHVRKPSGSAVSIRVDSTDRSPHEGYHQDQHDSPGGVLDFRGRGSTTYKICLFTAPAQTEGVAVAVHIFVSGEYVPLDDSIKIRRVRDAEESMHGILELANRILWEQSYLSDTALRRDDASMLTAHHARNLAFFVLFLTLLAGFGHVLYLKTILQRSKSRRSGRMV
jgi:emp24/gp25L/p24 family/GOLD